MRGTGSVEYGDQITHGITPAHAGNRAGKAAFNSDFKDHPRTCGEQPVSFVVMS